MLLKTLRALPMHATVDARVGAAGGTVERRSSYLGQRSGMCPELGSAGWGK
jgi:hypothetical protein